MINKNVLVTGATGFVGFQLCKSLIARNYNVFCIVRSNNHNLFDLGLNSENILIGDLSSQDFILGVLNCFNINQVYHFAAQSNVGLSFSQPACTFNTNFLVTLNLIEAIKIYNKVESVFIASTERVYGHNVFDVVNECSPLNGVSPYITSKICMELMAKSYGKNFNLPIIIGRFSNIYGGGDIDYTRIIPGTIKSLLSDQRPVIRSNGLALRNYIYIDDAINACLKLSDLVSSYSIRDLSQYYENDDLIFNICADKNSNTIELVNLLISISQRDLQPIVLNETNDYLSTYVPSIQKISKFTNWKSECNLYDGLSLTFLWYAKNMHSIQGILL